MDELINSSSTLYNNDETTKKFNSDERVFCDRQVNNNNNAMEEKNPLPLYRIIIKGKLGRYLQRTFDPRQI